MMAAVGGISNHVDHGLSWASPSLNCLGHAPNSLPLAMPGCDFDRKLPTPSMRKPPALMANSLRQLDSSPTATPSALWPPTPSPSSAMHVRRATELAFRAAEPMASTREEDRGGTRASTLNADAGVFVPMAHAAAGLNASAGAFVPLAAPAPQCYQPPPAPPVHPAPFLPEALGMALPPQSQVPEEQGELAAPAPTTPRSPPAALAAPAAAPGGGRTRRGRAGCPA